MRTLFASILCSACFFVACTGDVNTPHTEEESPINSTVVNGAVTTPPEVSSNKVDEVTGFIDPVCIMEISENTTLTHTHDGVTYGFCSQGCRDKFAANPDEYLAALEE